ncbi:dynein axonemal heavy chain 2-like [Diachasmimorpha longicaudata]|uniref:dynein axonemal heavy chain 2-like n=1 Tax=Diachasmimorpha longicaudata TaxID=58733 RepID=UPI0030B91A5E
MKESMIRMYHLLHGTTGTSPVFHIEADLIDKKINFVPSLYEITELIGGLTSHLLEPLKRKFPRLRDLFSFPGNNSKDLHETLTEDHNFHKLQEKLNDEVLYCTQHIQQYLKSWESFADIWEVNRDMFITRYEKLNPTVASFDADIGRYTEVANNVKMQETVTTVHFLDINSDRLKAAIIKDCSLWQQKLTGLLLRITQMTLDGLYQYIAENSDKVEKEPRNLTEMQVMLCLLDRLKTEIHLKEEEFPKLQEQYQTLVKYEIPMTLEFKRKLQGLKIYWGQYLTLLSTSEVTIEENKVQCPFS